MKISYKRQGNDWQLVYQWNCTLFPLTLCVLNLVITLSCSKRLFPCSLLPVRFRKVCWTAFNWIFSLSNGICIYSLQAIGILLKISSRLLLDDWTLYSVGSPFFNVCWWMSKSQCVNAGAGLCDACRQQYVCIHSTYAEWVINV